MPIRYGWIKDEYRHVVFAIVEVRDAVRAEFDRFGLTAEIGDERLFETVDGAIAIFRLAGSVDLDRPVSENPVAACDGLDREDNP